MLSWDRRTKVHEIQEICDDWQTPNHAKFRHLLTISVRDIRCRKFVLPKIGGPKVTNIDNLLRSNTPCHANFIAIGQTM